MYIPIVHLIIDHEGTSSKYGHLCPLVEGRTLSLKGKITDLIILALPLLLYITSIIHPPYIVSRKTVKKIVPHDFKSDSKYSRIAYDVLIQPIRNGGLKVMDIDSKVKSLKAIW